MRFFCETRSDSLPRASLFPIPVLLGLMLLLGMSVGATGVVRADTLITPHEPPQTLPNRLTHQEASSPASGDDSLPPALDEPTAQIRVLLDALADTADEESADALAREVQGLWRQSGSDAVDLLMVRAGLAIRTRQYTTALDLLDTVISLAPDYVEGWNRRATVHFLRDDYALSIADVEQVLRLEPRHFGALSGIGIMLDELGRDRQARLFLSEALRVHPYLSGARQRLDEIERRLQGAPI